MKEKSDVWLGISAETWCKIELAVRECDRVEEIIVYGSRAKGTYRKFSDIDLTLKGEGLTHADLFPILTRLDDLNLPYEIDLSLYSGLDYAPLREEIDRTGLLLWPA